MIELTDDQARALAEPQADPPRLFNPRTKQAFVPVPVDEYRQLMEDAYDDSPWSQAELQAAAWETAERTSDAGDDEDGTSEVW